MKTPPRRKALKLSQADIRRLKEILSGKAEPSDTTWREVQHERLEESRRAARG